MSVPREVRDGGRRVLLRVPAGVPGRILPGPGQRVHPGAADARGAGGHRRRHPPGLRLQVHMEDGEDVSEEICGYVAEDRPGGNGRQRNLQLQSVAVGFQTICLHLPFKSFGKTDETTL